MNGLLAENEWRSRCNRHRERLAPFAEERRARQFAHLKHPIDDFLFEYYSFRPAELLRWSPGPDVLLEDARPGEGDIAWRDFEARDGGLILPAGAFPDHRIPFLRWAIGYLDGIGERAPSFHCFGLHEWAMVYRSADIRHDQTPLRLSTDAIAKVVDDEGLRCTHFDAFRFFTPAALPLNRIELTRESTDQYDQKGCIHVTMDLYKYAYKLAPWSSGELIADTFLLAWEARQLDMRASPYDLRGFGLDPIMMETRQGREEYVEGQRMLVEKAEPIRERLLGEYRRLLMAARSASEDLV